MSKAFTKESDANGDADDEDAEAGGGTVASGPNYITPQGLGMLRQELKTLLDDERPKIVEAVHWAAKNGDRSENGDYLYGKKRLREIDRRVRFLTKRLSVAEAVDASVHQGSEQVYFGATVTYAHADGSEHTVTIKGIDEVNSLNGEVSWISPIAKTLLRSRVGDELALQTPAGRVAIEVLAVAYPSAAA